MLVNSSIGHFYEVNKARHKFAPFNNSTMTCATGYKGTAANITCEAGGSWSLQTGCFITGSY